MNKIEFKITGDGSHTLYLDDLDETYHSVHGAIQEALHVYINAGLNSFRDKKGINVLEVGFGTGLNAFLTYNYALKNGKMINYTAIEAYPLALDLIDRLNFLTELQANAEERSIFLNLHQCDWESRINIAQDFSLTKRKVLLQDYLPQEQFDIIYFDAFGPRVQPEMWVRSIFDIMYGALSRGGILVTYCAKGSVKRTLREVGFTVENIPGPPGKREMTRACKL